MPAREPTAALCRLLAKIVILASISSFHPSDSWKLPGTFFSISQYSPSRSILHLAVFSISQHESVIQEMMD
ncbi:MAG: hypothetical protein EHM14_00885 [Methanothrix sp.]|nr:MAG: hypothetical protein EHM14_00885 [Methanothrix sp.]